MHVKLGASKGGAAALRAAPRIPLPGLVGSDPTWLRACRNVEASSTAGEWLVLSGEPGVGKLAILQAVQLRHQPVRRLELLDGADAKTDPGWSTSLHQILALPTRGVIVRHVDLLDGRRIRELSSALGNAKRSREESPLWVAVTVSRISDAPEMAPLLSLFPTTVEVPPLRLHPGDVQVLVTSLLGRLGPSEHLTCSPEAMATLSRSAWPGNVQQVIDTLREVLKHRRTGSIHVDDLPPSVRIGSRRSLSLIEAMERDAVVQALSDAQGDKTRAALALGMSRATIYRKIHDYGIVVPSR